MGSISILVTNLSSKENKSRDSNPGPLGAKLEHYPSCYAAPPPFHSVVPKPAKLVMSGLKHSLVFKTSSNETSRASQFALVRFPIL